MSRSEALQIIKRRESFINEHYPLLPITSISELNISKITLTFLIFIILNPPVGSLLFHPALAVTRSGGIVIVINQVIDVPGLQFALHLHFFELRNLVFSELLRSHSRNVGLVILPGADVPQLVIPISGFIVARLATGVPAVVPVFEDIRFGGIVSRFLVDNLLLSWGVLSGCLSDAEVETLCFLLRNNLDVFVELGYMGFMLPKGYKGKGLQ